MSVNISSLIELRHWLHSHPEISRNESKTAAKLREFLLVFAPPDKIIELDGAGFAAVFEGRKSGRTVLLRAELDALPIHEVNKDLPYRSRYDGLGHKCGHDGHMTILAGVAQLLANRPDEGRVVLLFQPDEETGTGAYGCCNHENFAGIRPDFAFALHNVPGFARGEVICRVGTFASEVKYISIKMNGCESHSAYPEHGINPAYALAALTMRAREIERRFNTDGDYALIVPIYNRMGVQSSGVNPGRGEAHYTLRSSRGSIVTAMSRELIEYAMSITSEYNLSVAVETLEEFKETVNAAVAFEVITQAAKLAGLSFRQSEQPFRWGEDFGEFTSRYPGGMFGLGAGEKHSALHSPDYDFPDELITVGITMFGSILKLILSHSHQR